MAVPLGCLPDCRQRGSAAGGHDGPAMTLADLLPTDTDPDSVFDVTDIWVVSDDLSALIQMDARH